MSRSPAKLAHAESGREHEAFAAFDRLAHDLRGPLASVRTALQMLRMTTLDPARTRELVDLADRQLMRAVALADAVADYARLSDGRLDLVREAVTVDRLVGDAADRIRGAAAGIQLQMDVAADSGSVSVDPMRLSQAIALLLESATRSGTAIVLGARRFGGSVVVEALAELDEHGDAIPDLLGEALIAAHGGRLARRADGLVVTLPALP